LNGSHFLSSNNGGGEFALFLMRPRALLESARTIKEATKHHGRRQSGLFTCAAEVVFFQALEPGYRTNILSNALDGGLRVLVLVLMTQNRKLETCHELPIRRPRYLM
jgi:hypothetical protein